MGAGEHKDVNELVQYFVNFSNAMLEIDTADEPNDLPGTGEIKCHFKTNHGKYLVQDSMENMESGNSEIAKYFGAVNQVISAIRVTSEKS